jgi:NADH:ubiquinone oxidoreductase subunit 5 (subunit L)/multisubunit Na+/H+ antiporter MnhA subunit
MSSIIVVIVAILTFTKRAQLPFSRWLPAAIAAPTPVRSLVHSSTLVTAGVWVLIKYLRVKYFFIVTIISLRTLLMARLGALREKDAKKIVALSTLRQLGLLYFSLSLGGRAICFFHLIIHAFAKAGLFMIVGNVIFLRFSEQDFRFQSIEQNHFLILLIVINVASLLGIVFFSGFFSKETILVFRRTLLTSIFLIVFLFAIVVLTLIYCLKLIFFILVNSSSSRTKMRLPPKRFFGPLFLAFISCLLGKLTIDNFIYFYRFASRILVFIWTFLVVGAMLVIKKSNYKRGFLFSIQLQSVLKIRKLILLASFMRRRVALTGLETLFSNFAMVNFLFSFSKRYIIFRMILLVITLLAL